MKKIILVLALTLAGCQDMQHIGTVLGRAGNAISQSKPAKKEKNFRTFHNLQTGKIKTYHRTAPNIYIDVETGEIHHEVP